MKKTLIALATFAALALLPTLLCAAPLQFHPIPDLDRFRPIFLPVDDADADGVKDAADNCAHVKNGDCEASALNCDVNGNGAATDQEMAAGNQADWNNDGFGDACQDTDADGILDYLDNCPALPNADQDPDACLDTDSDQIPDAVDNCADLYNPLQEDTDHDGIGDWCDDCRFVANPDQMDSDDDGIGDACQSDTDGDGIPDTQDNCPTVANPDQANSDDRSRGDACEPPAIAGNTTAAPSQTQFFPNDSGSCTMVASPGPIGVLDVFRALLVLSSPAILLAVSRRRREA
jgi:hypothetical protein